MRIRCTSFELFLFFYDQEKNDNRLINVIPNGILTRDF